MPKSGMEIFAILIVIILPSSAYYRASYQESENLVKRFFSYFRTDFPKGIPALEIEDPYHLPFELKGPRIVLSEAKIYGLPELVIENGYIDLEKLEGHVTIFLPLLNVIGNYNYMALIKSNTGILNYTITNVHVDINITMVIEDGVFQIQDIMQNLTKDDLFLNLTNLTWLQQIIFESGAIHMFFQPIADIAFIQNKNIILNETNYSLRQFSNSLPLLVTLPHSNKFYEQILGIPDERRNIVLFIGRLLHYADFDPIRPPGETISVIGVKVKLTDVEVSGVSDVTDMKTLKAFYHDKKISIKVSMVFPHIIVRYNAAFSWLFLNGKSRPRKITIHRLEINVTMVIDPSEAKSIQRIDIRGKADWLGNIERYNSESPFRQFINKAEKFMQTNFLSIFLRMVQPEIEVRLRKMNLEKAMLSFIRKM